MPARLNQKFEVGVFSGQYVTPVDPGYFEHLEKVRGETRKMKIMENAREAVANGSAGHVEFAIATGGVKVNDGGEVVPLETSSVQGGEDSPTLVNGTEVHSGKRKRDGSLDTPSPRDRMDISLHNIFDYSK